MSKLLSIAMIALTLGPLGAFAGFVNDDSGIVYHYQGSIEAPVDVDRGPGVIDIINDIEGLAPVENDSMMILRWFNFRGEHRTKLSVDLQVYTGNSEKGNPIYGTANLSLSLFDSALGGAYPEAKLDGLVLTGLKNQQTWGSVFIERLEIQRLSDSRLSVHILGIATAKNYLGQEGKRQVDLSITIAK